MCMEYMESNMKQDPCTYTYVHCELSHMFFLSAFPSFFPNFSSHRWWFLSFLSFFWLCVQTFQLCPTLCDPMDLTYSTRVLCPQDFPGKNTGVGCPSLLQGSSQPRDWTRIFCVSWIAGKFFTTGPPEKPLLFLYVSIYQCSSVLPRVVPIAFPLQAGFEELSMSFCVTLSFVVILLHFYWHFLCVWFMAFILCFRRILLLVSCLLYVIRCFSVTCLVFWNFVPYFLFSKEYCYS